MVLYRLVPGTPTSLIQLLPRCLLITMERRAPPPLRDCQQERSPGMEECPTEAVFHFAQHMCTRACVCACTCACVYMYVCVHTCIRMCLCICVHMCLCVHVHGCAWVRMHVYVCMFVCAHAHLCMQELEWGPVAADAVGAHSCPSDSSLLCTLANLRLPGSVSLPEGFFHYCRRLLCPHEHSTPGELGNEDPLGAALSQGRLRLDV